MLGRHIAPERWADLAAGRLRDAEARRMIDHAARCRACARARDSVRIARSAMADIARTPAPELGWDHVRARVYWAVSSERKAQERRSTGSRARGAAWIGGGALAVAGVAALVVAAIPASHPLPALPATVVSAPPVASEPIPVGMVPMLTGVVTMAAGEVAIDGAAMPVLDRKVIAGSVLRTDDGRVGVQFERGSGFSVGPDSTVVVRSFAASLVELEVPGEITVEVSHRRADQRFRVLAGSRAIEVRGTAFRVVHRDHAVRVACSHGRVAVSDAAGSADPIEVGAGTSLAIADGEPLLGRRPAPLDEAALATLTGSIAPVLPAWTGADDAYSTSGPLAIAAPRGGSVRVDGRPVGRGEMTLRVNLGRHMVEAEHAPGRWSRGQWIEVDESGAAVEVRPAQVARRPAVTSAAARAERKTQLEAGLDHGRIATCLRALTKQGITGTYVELEIGVDASGAVSFLNIAESELPRSTAACVRDVVGAIRFPPGAEATWRHRLSF